MQRSYCTSALIVSIKEQSENNCTVTLLTEDSGIIYVTLYGGHKSRLRSLVNQWNSGKIWLYTNPEKNQTKINDFEVLSYHSSFAQNLFKLYAANLVSEIAIKTKCAGSVQKCFKLITGFLDGMELCDEEQSRVGLIRFLWRYIELMGVIPDASCCSECGKSFISEQFTAPGISYYNNFTNSFICSDCYKNLNTETTKINFFNIKREGLIYLSAITVLQPSEVRKLQIDKQAYDQIKQIIFILLEKNIESKLNSIETGVGIL
ncbi:MAG: DNA repair protein RecO [Treponema sp.]|nr:DNA repair protein RecO [Treponema sp.]